MSHRWCTVHPPMQTGKLAQRTQAVTRTVTAGLRLAFEAGLVEEANLASCEPNA